MGEHMKSRFFLSTLATLSFAVLNGCATNGIGSTNKTRTQPSSDSPNEAILDLKAGNERFISGHVRRNGQSMSDIRRLSTGQNPHAIVLSCSDSRLPPEAIFDQKLGELFTVRSAGETLSPTAIASIEYAVAKLGSKLIVVLGHTSCGAIKAAVETIGGASAGSTNLDQLVRDIHPRIRSVVENHKADKDLIDVSWANAKGVAKDLLTRSKILSDAVQSGSVKIQVGLYHLETGAVTFED